MSQAMEGALTPRGPFGSDDPEILAILDDYLATLEQGKQADLAEWVARHPELAHDLKAYIDSINFLHLASRDLHGLDDASTMAEDWTGRKLGDYEIVREVGRGGMGVVYEARQSKLGRRVALKILPLAAVLDKRQTARFLIEAQAAAQLSHPHIVPVYDVGCERGIHYYSMRYIEGQSLDIAIQSLKQRQASSRRGESSRTVTAIGDTCLDAAGDSFTTASSIRERPHLAAVARWGVQAAEALQHAHDYGIVHRDIKPSNLMVDRDGNLCVADFGLARCQADSAITLTGAVVGTARYMSPEQALGRRGMVDHRTDIYCLGGTLYELLTLRTVYPADSVAELLRQLESREPVAPRRLNPSIPFDLETIVLKAISKRRGQRYGTAQELADDLRRFLAGEPIAARRPSWVERASRWSSRHKNLVVTAAGVTLLSLFGTSTAAVFIAHAKSATETALQESKHHLERSRSSFRQSREVLDHFGLLVVDRLAGLPGAERVRSEILRETLQYYERFIAQAERDPTLQMELAMTCFKAGELLDRLGSRDKALSSYERARDIFARLEDDGTFAHTAACDNNIGLLLTAEGNVDQAKAAYGRAIRLYEKCLSADETNVDCRRQLASVSANLALLLAHVGERDDALTKYHRALDLNQKLAHAHPEQPEFQREWAVTLNNLSYFHRTADPVRAVALNQQAIELLRAVASAAPNDLGCQSDLALSLTNQGALWAGDGDYLRAETAYREAVQLYAFLLRQMPQVFAYRRDLAIAHNNLGRTLMELGQHQAARRSLEDARDILHLLAKDAPRDLVIQSSLGGVLNNLGLAYEQAGDPTGAADTYERAMELQRSAVTRAPRLTAIAEFLDRTSENYARALATLKRNQDAEKSASPAGTLVKP